MNNNNASTDHHQWLHYYQQTTAAANPAVMTSAGGGTGSGFSDISTSTSTIVTTSFTTNNTSSLSKSTSLGNTSDVHVHLNPQASVGKPIRRRSRAPRTNPTTLLNANTANFRSLVQKFTGCQNIKASSFGSRKGPVNLSFGVPRNQNDRQIISTSSRIAPVGSEYFHDQLMNPVVHDQLMNPVVHDQHQGRQQWQQQEISQKLQINNNKNMQSRSGLDEFAIDDLHELINIESSSFTTGVDKQQDGNYYF